MASNILMAGNILFRQPLNCRGKYFMSCVSFIMVKWPKFNHTVSVIFPYVLYFIPNIHVINTSATFSDISIAVESKAAPWKVLYIYVMFKKKTWLTLNSLAFMVRFYPSFLLYFYYFLLCSSKIQNIGNLLLMYLVCVLKAFLNWKYILKTS